ncbi:MAG: hypothetical protein ACOY90_10855 [Candidatus Zhuqueibacterota bacterium]
MVGQAILFEAKAFLCWEKFPQATVQLIPIQDEVAYFFPPNNDASTITLFYNAQNRDCSGALFLLFHEAGHLMQWQHHAASDSTGQFWQLIHLDKGERKMQFETEAWKFARTLLEAFIVRIDCRADDLLEHIDRYAEKCILSYR